MSEAKTVSPDDKCASCGHARRLHKEPMGLTIQGGPVTYGVIGRPCSGMMREPIENRFDDGYLTFVEIGDDGRALSAFACRCNGFMEGMTGKAKPSECSVPAHYSQALLDEWESMTEPQRNLAIIEAAANRELDIIPKSFSARRNFSLLVAHIDYQHSGDLEIWIRFDNDSAREFAAIKAAIAGADNHFQEAMTMATYLNHVVEWWNLIDSEADNAMYPTDTESLFKLSTILRPIFEAVLLVVKQQLEKGKLT